MILVINKINFLSIIYILYLRLIFLFKKEKIILYTLEKKPFLQNLLNCEYLHWQIININENGINKLIDINYIKSNQLIEDLYLSLNLNKFIKENFNDQRIGIYIKKSIYSDNLPGSDINIKKFLIIVETIKIKFKQKNIYFLIDNFKFLYFFKNYYRKDLKILSFINFNLLTKNLINYCITKLITIIINLSKFFKKNELNYNSNSYKNIIIESPFESIDENYNFNDKDFIFTSYLHPLSKESRSKLEKGNFCFKAINIDEKNNNKFEKNKKDVLLSFFEEKELKFNHKDSYINKLFINFYLEKKIWFNFFVKNESKVYYSNYKWSKHLEPACSAIDRLDGISLLSYHSFYEYVSTSSITSSDILLSFNNNFENREKKAGSIHKINIPVGYPKKQINEEDLISKELNSYFENKNVQKIILFLDQGNSSDERFDLGIKKSSEGFEIIFEILLKYPNIGVIIKPKKPKYIHQKLKNIYNFESALKTKRVYIDTNFSENNSKNLKFPPYIPAMISDLVIHDHLVAATAGLEAKINCKRTIYFDHYNFEQISIFKNFKNKENLIFNDWSILKESVENYILNKNDSLGKWDMDDYRRIIKNTDSYPIIKDILNRIKNSYKYKETKLNIIESLRNYQ